MTATVHDESFVHRVADAAAAEREAYAQGAPRPLGSYGVLLAVYGAMIAVLGLVVRRRRSPLPDRIRWQDLALTSIATYRLSRLVTKDSVTAVVRAPFTRFDEATGEGEVSEQVRGNGLRHAIGELLTCPFCIAQWIATAFAFGLVLAPRATRLAAAVLTAATASDWLQYANSALKRMEHEAA